MKKLGLLLAVSLLPRTVAAAQPTVRIVGYDEQARTALVHFEQKGEKGEAKRLYLGVFALIPEGEWPGWENRRFDGYEGLAAWDEAHRDAPPAEREKVALKLRNANWKKMEKELSLTGVKRKKGSSFTVHYLVDNKLAPEARTDTVEGDKQTTRFVLKSLGKTLVQSCGPGPKPESCSAAVVEGDRTLTVTTGVELEAVYVDPTKTSIVAIDRNAHLDEKGSLEGVIVIDPKDLATGPAIALKPGAMHLLRGCSRQRCWLLNTPSVALDDLNELAEEEAVRIESPQAERGAVLVKVAYLAEGKWVTGWVHPRTLAPEPLPPELAGLFDLHIVDYVGGAGEAKYRVRLQNLGTAPVKVPKGQVKMNYHLFDCDGSVDLGAFEGRVLPASSQVTLIEVQFLAWPSEECGALQVAARWMEKPPLTQKSTPVSLTFEFDSPKAGPSTEQHAVELPMRLLDR